MSRKAEFGFEVDKIYRGDSRHMKEVPDGVVSLIVTSPPYNVKKPYTNHDDAMPLEEYEVLLLDVWKECRRVLRPGGRLCVNVAGVWRQPYLPLHALIWHQLVSKLEFQMRGEVIWNKAASVGVSTAWGSFASPSNPTLRDVHEYVLVAERGRERNEIQPVHQTISVFSKDDFRLPNQTGLGPDIENEDFVEWTKSVWHIATESSSRVGHPAPFPEDLPRRLILLYTYPGDIVLDPFAGSGSACAAALRESRHYIGYDIDEGYVRIARKRMRLVSKETSVAKSSKPLRDRRVRMPKAKSVYKALATALVGETDVRDREVRVDVQDGQVVIGIKTLGTPDRQKQNIIASLPRQDAQSLATSLLRAAEMLKSDQ